MSLQDPEALQPKIREAWARLGTELKTRSIEPWGPTFTAYFIGGVIVFGGLGTWVELLFPDAKLNGTLTSLLTFFPALIGATSFQMVLEESSARSLRAFAYVAMLAFFGLVLVILGVSTTAEGLAIVIATMASILSLWVWVVANARNRGFQDNDVDTDDPVGGPTTTAPTGDLRGFQF